MKKPDFKETKALQKFRSRIEYIHQHLQMSDASLSKSARFLKKYTPKTESIAKALGEKTEIHNRLNHPVSTSIRLINYSRGKNAEYSIIELYSCFTEYMKNILAEMYRKEPIKIVQKIASENKDNKLTFAEIVKLGDYSKISELMIDRVFRKLENERSTTNLLTKILNHTKIELNKELTHKSLMYLQMRHLFIHNKGRADKLFETEFNDISKIKSGNKLPTNFQTISEAIKCVKDLCTSIDEELINNGLVLKRELIEKAAANISYT